MGQPESHTSAAGDARVAPDDAPRDPENAPGRIFAVVPAAGRSRRMGRPKQLLDVHGQTMLESSLAPLLTPGIALIVLVTHKSVAERLPQALPEKILVVRNDAPHTEMIDSIRIGLRTLHARKALRKGDGILVCPADHPGISMSDVDQCICAFHRSSDQIILATRDNKRGHPIIFPVTDIPFVHSSACDQGLNALPRLNAPRVTNVPCTSPGICRDVDTPQDYRSLG